MSTPEPSATANSAPIVVNVTNSNTANAYTGARLHGPGHRRRQSFWVHFWLLLLTAGIGNVIYAVHISRWNFRRGL